MDPVKLTEDLRGFAGRIIRDDDQLWVDRIRPQLPNAPFTPAFLEEILAPLDLSQQAAVLEFLARLGRKEVAELAAARVDRADGGTRIFLGTTLMICGDRRGCDVLEKLYRHSVDFPDDKPNSVPPAWITDTLFAEFGGDAAAEALNIRLVAYSNQRRAQRN